jgi:hypothetical protein
MLGIVPGNYSAGGLSVNGANLYFAAWLPSNEGGGIYTVPIGGGTPSPLQQFSSGEPSDVVTDSTSVYWSDIGTTGTAGVYSIPLGTGGGTITTLASDLGEPVHLAVDTANVYTGDFKSGAVLEIPISGSGAKTLVTSIRPNGVATDTGELVYFTTDTSICTVMK